MLDRSALIARVRVGASNVKGPNGTIFPVKDSVIALTVIVCPGMSSGGVNVNVEVVPLVTRF